MVIMTFELWYIFGKDYIIKSAYFSVKFLYNC